MSRQVDRSVWTSLPLLGRLRAWLGGERDVSQLVGTMDKVRHRLDDVESTQIQLVAAVESLRHGRTLARVVAVTSAALIASGLVLGLDANERLSHEPTSDVGPASVHVYVQDANDEVALRAEVHDLTSPRPYMDIHFSSGVPQGAGQPWKRSGRPLLLIAGLRSRSQLSVFGAGMSTMTRVSDLTRRRIHGPEAYIITPTAAADNVSELSVRIRCTPSRSLDVANYTLQLGPIGTGLPQVNRFELTRKPASEVGDLGYYQPLKSTVQVSVDSTENRNLRVSAAQGGVLRSGSIEFSDQQNDIVAALRVTDEGLSRQLQNRLLASGALVGLGASALVAAGQVLLARRRRSGNKLADHL